MKVFIYIPVIILKTKVYILCDHKIIIITVSANECVCVFLLDECIGVIQLPNNTKAFFFYFAHLLSTGYLYKAIISVSAHVIGIIVVCVIPV